MLRETTAPILVTGCAVNIDEGFYADVDARIVCERDKGRIPSRARELAGDARPERHDDVELAAMRADAGEGFRTRVDLKIQDGCDNACSYCIVHVARGPARSLPARQVLEQAKALGERGVGELVLVGIDLAAYRDGGTDLAGLTDMLLDRTDVGRVRISSVEPQSVTSSLVDALARSNGRLCRHLHLCLQSGCDKTLEQMNRHYDARSFLRTVEQLREAAPGMALSTDVIVGFPGETDEDFEESCRFVEECGFMRLHVFRYSKRPGTPAAQRADQVDPKVKAERSEALIALGKRLVRADMERRLGTRELVVVERPGLGTSESYHAVACDESIIPGSLVELEFHDIDDRHMRLVAS